jgi:hypothetical protein
MKVSDSSWHKQLSDVAAQSSIHETPYWLVPFENYKTFCPCLVGDYATVSNELALYVVAGYETFILDIPPNHEELSHTSEVFKQATKKASIRKSPWDTREPSIPLAGAFGLRFSGSQEPTVTTSKNWHISPGNRKPVSKTIRQRRCNPALRS